MFSPQYEGLGWLWCCGGRGALEERRRQEKDKDKVLIAFTMWDTDGDGYLSWEEFQKISNNTSMSQDQALRIFQHCDKVYRGRIYHLVIILIISRLVEVRFPLRSFGMLQTVNP